MSFNIRYDNPNDNENWWNNRKPEVVEFINSYHPNILGIQEGLDNQVKYILENTTNYSYIGVGRDDGMKQGEFSAIFFDTTKLDLIYQNTIWLSKTPEKVSVGWDASMERICTYGYFKDSETGNYIYVFNTHFDHIGVKARKKSAKLILSTIKNLGISDSALIVTGDLNSEPTSKPLKILTRKLEDPVKVLVDNYSGPMGTFNNFNPATDPKTRIDYILTSNLGFESYSHINDKRKNGLCISDHLPIFAVLRY